MRIFIVGSDNSIFNNNERFKSRLIDYSSIIDGLTIVVPYRQSKKISLNGKILYCGSGGSNKLSQFLRLTILSFKLLSSKKFDVISSQDSYFFGLLSMVLSKIFHIGFAVQIHGFEKFYGLRKSIAKFVIPRADSVRVVSLRLRKEMIEDFGVNSNIITVVPIFSDLPSIEPLPIRDNGNFIFLTISRLVDVKNIPLQIKAFNNFVSHNPNSELWIVGDGQLEKTLKDMVSCYLLENKVKFWGRQENLDVFYRQADVFMLTSNCEGWGLTVVEAANYSLPIIMTDVGCANELIINHESGIVIPKDDLVALEKSMFELYDNQNLRQIISQNAKRNFNNLFTKEEILRLYKQFWKLAKK